MTLVTHALTMNGRIHGELKDPVAPPAELIRQRLLLLDGSNRFSLSLWAIPPDTSFDQIDLRVWPQEYIQAAGSRDRLMVEMRRVDGLKPRQYLVGHKTSVTGEHLDPDVPVHWNGCETTVLQREVFDIEEAGGLFVAYYTTGSVPPQYALRELVFHDFS
ncbi:hypothetical protein [Frankia sp. Cas4]|uniref:hypothetical protein n=1 Tax=Frankia sp. Cas4 TaxID=3073927 RepID=UPI002AD44131|nr:hypothetical protein [Frankia sp. Cas4]